MSVAGPGLNGLIENLNQLSSHNSPLIGADVRKSIDNLLLELRYLQSMIGDLSRYDYESSYLKEIRGIVDEVEDAVDNYVVLGAAQKSKNWVARISLPPKELKDAGRQIANMSDKLSQIGEKTVRVLQSLATTRVTSRPRMSSQVLKVEEDHVVGFKTPAEKVTKLLVEGHENLEVIVIAGMAAGLGKTTLAKMVYKDPNVHDKFMIRAFVYVSRQYDKTDVLLQILASFSTMNDDQVMQKSEKDLETYVFEQLKGKQYLIVLDDVWEPEDWDAFKGIFPNNDKRCRVLITTTNTRLAEYANPKESNSLCTLDFLSFDNSRELLERKVFGREKFLAGEFEQYAGDIAKNCGGLPLAIVIIAGVLWNRRDRISWWKEVSDRLSEGASEGKILKMMYENLPNKLKPCFLYLGVFPRGYEIPVRKLVRLWISEGFIDGEGNPNLELEDIAEQYLEELVQRNLMMVGRRRSSGKMKTCHLHDTLGEFCKKEADEENLFQEVNGQRLHFYSSGHSGLDSFRRLCINNSITAEYLSGPVSGKHVRSFLTFQKKLDNVDPKHVSDIQKAFNLLKVLELPSFSTDMSRLVLLKYLAVSSNISSIPSAFSGLWSLQTLIVSTASETLKVEMDLWKMPHFRHFHTKSTASFPSSDTKTPKSEESSSPETSVRTLCTISPECCSGKFLDRTPRLKKLGIRGDLAKFYQNIGESKFGKLQHLENLKLIAGLQPELQPLPSTTCFPSHLTKLTLMKALLGREDLSTIGKLEKLEVLKLKNIAFQGNAWFTEDRSFPRLVYLYIGSTDLSSWKVASATTFPSLTTLQLNGCEKLEALPAVLVEIPSLQSVVLRGTNPKLASSTKNLVLKINEPGRGGDKRNNVLRLSVCPTDHLDTQWQNQVPEVADQQSQNQVPEVADQK